MHIAICTCLPGLVEWPNVVDFLWGPMAKPPLLPKLGTKCVPTVWVMCTPSYCNQALTAIVTSKVSHCVCSVLGHTT